jgi:beta-mannosidase
MLARSIFSDVMSSCGAGGQCYVRNDRPVAFSGALTVTAVTLATGATTVLYSAPALSLPAGPGAATWFTLPSTPDSNTTVLVIDVVDGAALDSWRILPTFASPLARTTAGSLVSSNLVLYAPPVYLSLPAANVAFNVASAPNADGTVDVTVTTDAPALFVTLTTLAQGRFSDNAFLLLPGDPRVIQYIPFVSPTDIDVLTTTVRVEHVASYL